MSKRISTAELLGPEPSFPRVQVVAERLPSASAVAMGSRAYDAASDTDQLKMWGPLMRMADAEILPDKPKVDARAGDTLRNDALVAGGSNQRKDSIVGAVYLLNAKPMTKVLFGKEDEMWEDEFQEEVETKFTLTAESSQHYLDAQRTKTFTDQIRLAIGVDLAGGEVLSTSEWMPDDGRPCRTACQDVDAMRLSTPADKLGNANNNFRGGVERDMRGAPIAYHIRMGYPNDYTNPNSFLWRRVMARKPWGRPQVLHLYDQLRPDQSRGISAMVTGLQEMKMAKGFRKTELQRAALAATYAASIESELPTHDVLRMMGGFDEDENAAVEWMREYLAAVNEYSNNSKNLDVNGTRIPILPTGTKLNLKNPGAESPSGSDFEASLNRYLAAAMDMGYADFSRDFSKTSYASGRLERGNTERAFAARKKRVADAKANFIYCNWLEEQINNNNLECLKRRRVPAYYEGLNAEAYSNADWIGAGGGMIDPLKETQAYMLAMNGKVLSREYLIAKMYGSDWRKMLRQIAREEKAYEAAGVDRMEGKNQDQANALSGSPQDKKS